MYYITIRFHYNNIITYCTIHLFKSYIAIFLPVCFETTLHCVAQDGLKLKRSPAPASQGELTKPGQDNQKISARCKFSAVLTHTFDPTLQR